MTDFLVVALPREEWKGTVVPLPTNNDSFYDLSISDDGNSGATIKFVKKKAESEIVHTVEQLQNKGVGKRLLDKAKEVVSKRKYRAILVEVQSYNGADGRLKSEMEKGKVVREGIIDFSAETGTNYEYDKMGRLARKIITRSSQSDVFNDTNFKTVIEYEYV